MNGPEQLQNKSQITEKNKDFEEFENPEDFKNPEISEDQKKTEDRSLKDRSEEMIGNNEDEAAKMEIYTNPKAESGPLDIRSVSKVISTRGPGTRTIIDEGMTLQDVPKRVWIFFFENDASSFP